MHLQYECHLVFEYLTDNINKLIATPPPLPSFYTRVYTHVYLYPPFENTYRAQDFVVDE